MFYLFTNKLRQNLTRREFNKQLTEIKKENQQKMYQEILKKERKKYSRTIHFETSKFIAIYLFALLNIIVIYSMVVMWRFVDFSYLGVLISDIAAQVLIYAIYCMKAYKAKKSEEELKFEREKLSCSLNGILQAGAESKEPVTTSAGSFEVSDFETETDNNSVG